MTNAGYTRQLPLVVATANLTLKRVDAGKLFLNTGAAGAVTFALPTDASPGDVFHFQVDAGQTLNVDPGAAGTVKVTTTQGTAAQKASNNVVGSTISFVCTGAGAWLGRAIAGTWTVS